MVYNNDFKYPSHIWIESCTRLFCEFSSYELVLDSTVKVCNANSVI